MPDLPSGTVAFLFTDIEGSTALWEQDQAAMANAVDPHIFALEAATSAHGDAPTRPPLLTWDRGSGQARQAATC
jgi:class 3 adenylate cyclase